jgi:mono/diheme cytochrome c family protein
MRALVRRAAAVAAVGALACSAAVAQEVPAPPAGASEQVLSGSRLYQQHCALCHGPKGRDANVFPRPIWGPGHDIAKFGTAKGLFEYLQMLMPFDNPAKIDDTAKTAILAYMLVRNGNVKANVSMPRGGDQTGIK